METVENPVMCNVKKSTLMEWQRKLRSIANPMVDFDFDTGKMKDQVIRKSKDLADEILDEFEEWI